MLSRPSLSHKQAYTCFTASPPWLKRWYQAFPAHKQACTKLTGLPQRSKLLSRSSLPLKQACTCFTVHHRRLKRRFHVFSAHKQAYMSLTGTPQWEKLLSRPSLALKAACTCFNKLAPTSQGFTRGKNCFLDLLFHLNRPVRTSQYPIGC